MSQANETGGSQKTELEGAKRCFSFLQHLGLPIGIFGSDRHRGTSKWIRENCVNTKHYFDIWHVTRSQGKKLLALSREKGCEIIRVDEGNKKASTGVQPQQRLGLSPSSLPHGIHYCVMSATSTITTQIHFTNSAVMDGLNPGGGLELV